MKLRGFFIAIAVVGIGFLFITSCKKNTDCIANVICNDSTGVGIGGATVYLYANVKTPVGGTITADLRATGITDAGGKVSFTFKLPAIYDIKASKVISAKTYSALSIIKLEEGKGVDKTVVLR
ncbi:MAG TPA: hypothetical protein VN026_14670 [Bacteroidia bacterium]|jgi:hypothetical protein|nr:hypothetical protein [Bacteroidia bacterium]